MSEIGLSIEQVTVFDQNGISIFSQLFKENQMDQNLLAAFFSAIRQFGTHMLQGEIQGIKIGNVMLDFKIIPVENESLVFLMISSGFSENWASEIADKIAENFAIQFENFLAEKNIDYSGFRSKMYDFQQDFFTYYSTLCEEMVKEVNKLDTVSLDLPIKVPSTLLMFIYDLLAVKPEKEKLYEHGAIDVLVENIQNYVFSDKIKKDILIKLK
ncbi:MAG TPA: hypothetical protein VKM55_10985 [Candidatus Lokiarchaeia archaeon]|nr:hypothetical protein [Candidatus Lokiarchaeia archaeon]